MAICILLVDGNPQMLFKGRLELAPPWNNDFTLHWIDNPETFERFSNSPIGFQLVLLDAEFGFPGGSVNAAAIEQKLRKAFGDSFAFVRFNRHKTDRGSVALHEDDVDLAPGVVIDEFAHLMSKGLPLIRQMISKLHSRLHVGSGAAGFDVSLPSLFLDSPGSSPVARLPELMHHPYTEFEIQKATERAGHYFRVCFEGEAPNPPPSYKRLPALYTRTAVSDPRVRRLAVLFVASLASIWLKTAPNTDLRKLLRFLRIHNGTRPHEAILSEFKAWPDPESTLQALLRGYPAWIGDDEYGVWVQPRDSGILRALNPIPLRGHKDEGEYRNLAKNLPHLRLNAKRLRQTDILNREEKGSWSEEELKLACGFIAGIKPAIDLKDPSLADWLRAT